MTTNTLTGPALLSHKLPITTFFRVLTAAYTPTPLFRGARSEEISHGMVNLRSGAAMLQAADRPFRSLYRPYGTWAWTEGKVLHDCHDIIQLSGGKKYQVYFKTGKIGDQELQLMCKSWPLNKSFENFVSELALYKVQLKPLQGVVAPRIIGVFTGTNRVNVGMELPHHSFWIQASPDMPDVLKTRCIEAFESLHAQGVCHGDPELSNILIGGDARITIVNFHCARALVPNPKVYLGSAKAQDLRLELRKVKYKIDYQNAREKEREKYARFVQREERNRTQRLLLDRNPFYVPEYQDEPGDDILDPPVNVRERVGWLVDADFEPSRFIVPGQTSQTYDREFRRFLDIILSMEVEKNAPSAFRLPSPSPPPGSSTAIPESSTRTPQNEVEAFQVPRYSLGKRKPANEETLVTPPAKRIRATKADTTASSSQIAPPIAELDWFVTGSTFKDRNIHFSIHNNNANQRLPPVRVRDFAYKGDTLKKAWRGTTAVQNTREVNAGPSTSHSNTRLSGHSQTAQGKRRREGDEMVDQYSESNTKSKRLRVSAGESVPKGKKQIPFLPGTHGRTKAHKSPMTEVVGRDGAGDLSSYAQALVLHRRQTRKSVRKPRTTQLDVVTSLWEDILSNVVTKTGNKVASWFQPQDMENPIFSTPLVFRSMTRWIGDTLGVA